MRVRRETAPSRTRLVGYARVSTEEQGTDPQLDELPGEGVDGLLRDKTRNPGEVPLPPSTVPEVFTLLLQ